MRESLHIIPAAPGWFALTFFDDEHGSAFVADQIIAWKIEASPTPPNHAEAFTTLTYPIGIEHIAPDAPIRRPDGRIVFPEDCEFPADNEAGAIEYARQRASRKATR